MTKPKKKASQVFVCNFVSLIINENGVTEEKTVPVLVKASTEDEAYEKLVKQKTKMFDWFQSDPTILGVKAHVEPVGKKDITLIINFPTTSAKTYEVKPHVPTS